MQARQGAVHYVLSPLRSARPRLTGAACYIVTVPTKPPFYTGLKMPSRDVLRAFLLLYLVTGVVVLVQSLQTVWAAHLKAIRPQDQMHAMILGSFEAGAALLFLIPRTMRWGAVGLLMVFVAAFALHATHGPNWALLIYAAVVLFIRVHGVQSSYFSHLRVWRGISQS